MTIANSADRSGGNSANEPARGENPYAAPRFVLDVDRSAPDLDDVALRRVAFRMRGMIVLGLGRIAAAIVAVAMLGLLFAQAPWSPRLSPRQFPFAVAFLAACAAFNSGPMAIGLILRANWGRRLHLIDSGAAVVLAATGITIALARQAPQGFAMVFGLYLLAWHMALGRFLTSETTRLACELRGTGSVKFRCVALTRGELLAAIGMSLVIIALSALAMAMTIAVAVALIEAWV